MQITQKPVNIFNKGLITEAGELTFPEGASVDELNCSLLRDGSRRRRLGIEYESSYTTTASATLTSGVISSVHLWKDAGGVAGLNFVVVQLGATVHFYTETSGALSGQRKTFTINLTTYVRPSGSASSAKIDVASSRGELIIVSPEINSLRVEYDEGGDNITVTQIAFEVRDFEWQGDRSTYSEELATGSVTNARKYDTANTGWTGTKGSAALTTYETANTAYPPLNLPWYSGKDATGAFAVAEFEKIFAGTSLIGNGHFIYDLYSIDRSTNITGATDYTETSRFSCVAAFSGRVFYAGMSNKNVSNIYFSQVIGQSEDVGKLLQVNDPTSEEFPDLLDTDGGFINIPEAYNIKKLHVIGNQLLVFSENGVWSIRGIDNVFRASEYSVTKISDAGLAYEGSFVAENGGRPYWWSATGIYTLTASAESQTLQEQNVSLTTIQSFYDDIDPAKRAQVTGAYDSFNNRVAWCYPDDSETIDYKVNKILWLDEQLGAFYPWTISDNNTSQYILHPFFIEGNATADVEFTVVDGDGNIVVDGSGNTVVVTRSGREYTSSALKFLVRTDDANKVTFAEFTNTGMLDWGAANYTSYVEGGYDFMGDLTTKKNTVYMTTYCKITEDSITGTDGGGYEFERPSSCKVSTYWDYKTSASQTAQEAYRLKELPIPTQPGSFTYPKTVTVSRLRLRGRGRTVRVRFESTTGYDFHLLGYDMISAKKGRL